MKYEEFYKYVFEFSPDAITITDLNGNITECNPATLKLHNYKSKEELLGKNAFEIIAPKDRERAVENAKKTLETGMVQNIEYLLLRKDGTEFPAELSASLIRDVSGKPAAFMAITVDISKRKMAEQALRESEEKWQSLVMDIPDIVLLVEPSGKIIFINRTLVGGDAKQWFGRNIFEFLMPEYDSNGLRELFDKVMDTGKVQSREFRGIILNGEFGWYSVSVGPVKIDNNVTKLIIVARDITEVKKLEKYRSEFIANVSHELKTPMTSIRNYVETLLNGAIEDKKNNLRFLKKIESESQYLQALIDDILEISRLEGRIDIGPFITLDIRSVVKRVVSTLSENAERKKIGIDTSKCRNEELLIRGNEEYIFRALKNIFENALNYTDSGGEIEIYCVKQEDNVGIVISDTGIGIEKEHIARIFERFYRTDTARSRDQGGTGLGLSIVKHIMSLHNGKILVESELGKGSKFTLLFPQA